MYCSTSGKYKTKWLPKVPGLREVYCQGKQLGVTVLADVRTLCVDL